MKLRHMPNLVLIASAWGGVVLVNSVVLPMRYSPRVAVETVEAAPLALVVRAAGNLDAKASVTVKAEFDGPVVSKNFHEGEDVVAGQKLAVIGRDRIRLEYQGKLDGLHNAKSDLIQAKKEVKLQKTLFDKQAVAYSAVEDAQRNLVKATQALRSAQEAFNLEQKIWEASVVVAPFFGTVVKDSLGDDRSVAAGREIVTVADVSGYAVKAHIDELDIKRVEENQPADIHLQIYPDKTFKARVTQIGSQPESADSSAIPVVLTLEENDEQLLRPKLTADVRILTGQTSPIMSVPLTAVVNTDGNPHVWILDLLHRLRLRPVTLGRSTPDRVEVTQGLQVGDRVATIAEPDWADGMQVWLGPPKNLGAKGSRTQQLLEKWVKSSKPDPEKRP